MDDVLRIVLDEVALEGLEGCEVEALWQRIGASELALDLDDFNKQFIWNMLLHSPLVSFYLREERKKKLLVMPPSSKEYGSSYLPILPVSDYPEQRGSLFFTGRVPIDAKTECPNFTDAAKYGERLVLVADAEIRWRVLVGNVTTPQAISGVGYAILERIAMMRFDGASQVHLSKCLDMEYRNMHYPMKRIQAKSLIQRRFELRSHVCYLPQFFSRSQDINHRMEMVTQFLATQPDQSAGIRAVQLAAGFSQKTKASEWRTLREKLVKMGYVEQVEKRKGEEGPRVQLRLVKIFQQAAEQEGQGRIGVEEGEEEDEEMGEVEGDGPVELLSLHGELPPIRQLEEFIRARGEEGIAHTDLWRTLQLPARQSYYYCLRLIQSYGLTALSDQKGKSAQTKLIAKEFKDGALSLPDRNGISKADVDTIAATTTTTMSRARTRVPASAPTSAKALPHPPKKNKKKQGESFAISAWAACPDGVTCSECQCVPEGDLGAYCCSECEGYVLCEGCFNRVLNNLAHDTSHLFLVKDPLYANLRSEIYAVKQRVVRNSLLYLRRRNAIMQEVEAHSVVSNLYLRNMLRQMESETMIDKKTSLRIVGRLEQDGLLKTACVVVPLLNGAFRFAMLVMLPSVSVTDQLVRDLCANLSKRLIGYVPGRQLGGVRVDELDVEDTEGAAEGETPQQQAFTKSAPTLIGRKSHLRGEGDERAVVPVTATIRLQYGYHTAKFIRAKMLHLYLWKLLYAKSIGADTTDNRHLANLRGTNDMPQTPVEDFNTMSNHLTIADIMTHMPLYLFCEVIGAERKVDTLDAYLQGEHRATSVIQMPGKVRQGLMAGVSYLTRLRGVLLVLRQLNLVLVDSEAGSMYNDLSLARTNKLLKADWDGNPYEQHFDFNTYASVCDFWTQLELLSATAPVGEHSEEQRKGHVMVSVAGFDASLCLDMRSNWKDCLTVLKGQRTILDSHLRSGLATPDHYKEIADKCNMTTAQVEQYYTERIKLKNRNMPSHRGDQYALSHHSFLRPKRRPASKGRKSKDESGQPRRRRKREAEREEVGMEQEGASDREGAEGREDEEENQDNSAEVAGPRRRRPLHWKPEEDIILLLCSMLKSMAEIDVDSHIWWDRVVSLLQSRHGHVDMRHERTPDLCQRRTRHLRKLPVNNHALEMTLKLLRVSGHDFSSYFGDGSEEQLDLEGALAKLKACMSNRDQVVAADLPDSLEALHSTYTLLEAPTIQYPMPMSVPKGAHTPDTDNPPTLSEAERRAIVAELIMVVLQSDAPYPPEAAYHMLAPYADIDTDVIHQLRQAGILVRTKPAAGRRYQLSNSYRHQLKTYFNRSFYAKLHDFCSDIKTRRHIALGPTSVSDGVVAATLGLLASRRAELAVRVSDASKSNRSNADAHIWQVQDDLSSMRVACRLVLESSGTFQDIPWDGLTPGASGYVSDDDMEYLPTHSDEADGSRDVGAGTDKMDMDTDAIERFMASTDERQTVSSIEEYTSILRTMGRTSADEVKAQGVYLYLCSCGQPGARVEEVAVAAGVGVWEAEQILDLMAGLGLAYRVGMGEILYVANVHVSSWALYPLKPSVLLATQQIAAAPPPAPATSQKDLVTPTQPPTPATESNQSQGGANPTSQSESSKQTSKKGTKHAKKRARTVKENESKDEEGETENSDGATPMDIDGIDDRDISGTVEKDKVSEAVEKRKTRSRRGQNIPVKEKTSGGGAGPMAPRWSFGPETLQPAINPWMGLHGAIGDQVADKGQEGLFEQTGAVVRQPWLCPSTGLNGGHLLGMMEVIAMKVMARPGIPEETILRELGFSMGARSLQDILSQLESSGILYSRTSMKVPRPSLFSNIADALGGGVESGEHERIWYAHASCLEILAEYYAHAGEEARPKPTRSRQARGVHV